MQRRAHGLTRRSDIVFVIGLLLVHRIFGLGCGPKDGDDGGDCLDNGCNTYCNSGACDNETNTCGAAPYYPPSSGCSDQTGASVCGAREIPYSCLGGDTPGNDCRAEDGGVFCCPIVCATIAAACSGPTTSHRCNSGLGPDDAGACAFVLNSYDWVSCCTTSDTCFTPIAGNDECASGTVETFCTGNAPVPNEACATQPGAAQGGYRTYCCPEPDAGVSDAGIDAD